ncbi:MAG TPA: alpha/beta fold hydrolase [Acetobacteraceae bacterium]|nr:alpha/beta fold hydrolase [Acetobacteraceae bacterium]
MRATRPGAGGRFAPIRRRWAVLMVTLMTVGMTVGGCAAHLVPAGPMVTAPQLGRQVFVMPDGVRLPYRTWFPAGPKRAVMLALHGFNDSRDAFEIPAPLLAATGIAVYSPDLRGFGATSGRGYWPGTTTLVDDARTMARLLHAKYPHLPLYLLGESMGGAALMLLGAEPSPPPVAGYILAAPAVWGRADMNLFFRSALWISWKLAPGLTVSGAGLVKASDNRAALEALGEDPLTILDTRIDTLHGLVNLMSQALSAAPRFHGPALILYGARDQLVPKRAMAAMWRALPKGAPIRLAYYAHGYHLLLRDHDRGLPIGDIIAWIRDPHAPLPSGADRAARAWLAGRH